MDIVKYTLAMVKSDKSVLDTDDLLRIANVFEANDKVEIVIAENDETYGARYRGLVRGTIQLNAYICDNTNERSALTAIVRKPGSNLVNGFIIFNRNVLSIYYKDVQKEELIQEIISELTNSITWIEKL